MKNRKKLFRALAMVKVELLASLPAIGRTNFLSSGAQAAEGRRFRLKEATITDVHRAIRAKQLTAAQLVNLYLRRIKAYNGTCVEGAIDPALTSALSTATWLDSKRRLEENPGEI